MKEIHAYQNEDGTYRVEILKMKLTEKMFNKNIIKETTEAKLEIPRALIDITTLSPSDEDKSSFTITIEQEN